MLSLNHVSFAYDDTPVLQDVSLTVPDTGAVCLFGASGCGKTTLLRLLAGLEVPTAGQVYRPENLRVAMVFQENRLLPWLTVRQNVELVTADRDAVDAALAAVSLSDAAEDYPAALSGGMQRRVALARALAYGGDVLLLDEPFNGLDDTLKSHIAAAFREHFSHGAIVLVTHLKEEAALFDAAILSF